MRRQCTFPNRSLEELVEFLNGTIDTGQPLAEDARHHLAALITAWHNTSSSPLNALEREGGARLPPLLKMVPPKGAPTWRDVEKSLRAHFTPGAGGIDFHVVYGPGRAWTSWDFAWDLFIKLLHGKAIQRLGGPCRKCGIYYVRKTAKPSVYCSRQCASRSTAAKRTTEVRKHQHAEKLKLAAQGILAWQAHVRKGRTAADWKHFVANVFRPQSSTLTPITVRFLSRAVNSGELNPPSPAKTPKRT